MLWELNGTLIRRLGLFLAGALLAAAAASYWQWPAAVVATDIAQNRLNRTTAPPQANEQIIQSFFSDHNGLSQITVRLSGSEDPAAPQARATLLLLGPGGQTLAAESVANGQVAAPQSMTLNFPPIGNSRGERFQLILRGQVENQLTLQGYTLNTLPNSQLTGPDLNGVEVLFLQSRYTLLWGDALSQARALGARWLPILLIALAVVPLPGAVLLALWPVRWPAAVRWGAAWTLGIATWPLLWSGLTLLNGRWNGFGLGAFIALGWILALAFRWRRGGLYTPHWPALAEPLLMVLFLAAVLTLRLVSIRDAATLPWVDASRHALITAVMRDSGQMLSSYRPFLPVDLAPYHYGLHTLTAGIALLLPAVELVDLLPALMQMLTTIICLAVYSGAWLLTGRRVVGWLAALLVAAPFFFPGYYTTWGRLTQIAGLIILAVLIGLTWRLRARRGGRPRQALFVLLTAGLFLVHARVFLLFVPLWGLVIALNLRHVRRPQRLWPAAAWWLPMVVGVSALILPRLLTLTRRFPALINIAPSAPESPANVFPSGYLSTGWEREFWLAAALGVTCLLLVWLWQRPAERAIHGPLFLAAWIALLGLLVGGSYIHPRWPIWLPQVSLNSAYISLFVPQSMILAAAGWWLWRAVGRRLPAVQTALLGPLGGGFLALALFGANFQAAILNEQTLLVAHSDLAGINWLAENAPPEARVGHSGWQWLPHVWAGQDGGAWIVPLTGRFSITPPIDHIYSGDLRARTAAFNSAAEAIENWGSPQANVLLDHHQISHLFVGQRSGWLDPAELAGNPGWTLVFQQGGTFIFQKDE